MTPFSRSTVLRRARAAYRPAASPAGPPPMITISYSLRVIALRQRLLDRPLQVSLGPEAYDLVDRLSALEHQQGGNTADAVPGGGLHVIVGVELHELHLPVVLSRQLFHQGGDHAAGAAPGCPEVHEHGCTGLEYLFVERGVGHFGWLGHPVLLGPDTICRAILREAVRRGLDLSRVAW